MAKPRKTNEEYQVVDLHSDFDQRLQAARLAHHLHRIFVDPVDMSNPLAPDFSVNVIEERRSYMIGHWQIFFSVLLKDDRGTPPQIWLSLNFFHHFKREGEPVTVVSFDQFSRTTCRSIAGLELRSNRTSLIQKDIEIANVDTQEYAEIAREQIMMMLLTPVPVLTQIRRALRIFGLGKNNEVLNEASTTQD